MSNNTIFFCLYISILLSFLLLFSFFLSKQLFIIGLNKLQVVYLFRDLQKKIKFNGDSYRTLFNIYLFRGNTLISIALSEFLLEINNNLIQKDVVYASLAYAYYCHSFYSLAEYYYLKVLSFSPLNYQAMLNLANMYSDLGYETKAKYLLTRARTIESIYS
uniref:hypothetical protein Ycf37 n=1 Tax=Aphanocladia delicatula TaxID=3041656 RepID=UPI002551DFF7|nr:hypothetical protein Ycf37 [Aphanocladia delicatula]WGH14195.1 hypothetical protein Ycf37 [Aphanocladia delicatula]